MRGEDDDNEGDEDGESRRKRRRKDEKPKAKPDGQGEGDDLWDGFDIKMVSRSDDESSDEADEDEDENEDDLDDANLDVDDSDEDEDAAAAQRERGYSRPFSASTSSSLRLPIYFFPLATICYLRSSVAHNLTLLRCWRDLGRAAEPDRIAAVPLRDADHPRGALLVARRTIGGSSGRHPNSPPQRLSHLIDL